MLLYVRGEMIILPESDEDLLHKCEVETLRSSGSGIPAALICLFPCNNSNQVLLDASKSATLRLSLQVTLNTFLRRHVKYPPYDSAPTRSLLSKSSSYCAGHTGGDGLSVAWHFGTGRRRKRMEG